MRCAKKQKTEDEDSLADLPPQLRKIANETVATAVPIMPSSASKEWDSIPFGRFKGVPMEDVETWYLQWFVEHMEKRTNGLYEAVEAELWKRTDVR